MREQGDEYGAEVEQRKRDESPYYCEAPHITDVVERKSFVGRGIEEGVDVEGREMRSGVVSRRDQASSHLRGRVGLLLTVVVVSRDLGWRLAEVRLYLLRPPFSPALGELPVMVSLV